MIFSTNVQVDKYRCNYSRGEKCLPPLPSTIIIRAFRDPTCVGYGIYPIYFSVAYFADYGTCLLPVTKERTELLARWFVHEDAVEGVDYEAAMLIAMIDTKNTEDLVLAEMQARGVSSRRYVPCPHVRGAGKRRHAGPRTASGDDGSPGTCRRHANGAWNDYGW